MPRNLKNSYPVTYRIYEILIERHARLKAMLQQAIEENQTVMAQARQQLLEVDELLRLQR